MTGGRAGVAGNTTVESWIHRHSQHTHTHRQNTPALIDRRQVKQPIQNNLDLSKVMHRDTGTTNSEGDEQAQDAVSIQTQTHRQNTRHVARRPVDSAGPRHALLDTDTETHRHTHTDREKHHLL